MIYKNISIKTVIAKVIRDLGIDNQSIPYHDYIEWIADALKHIGSYYQFEEIENVIEISNYTGVLPCDFYKLVRLRIGCNKSINSTNVNHDDNTYTRIIANSGGDFSKLTPKEQAIIANPASPQLTTYHKNTTSEVRLNKHLFGNIYNNYQTCNDYNIQGNVINVGFESGYVTIQYLRIPTDDEGFPLIPDDVSYSEAFFWYIAYHISMRNPQLIPNPIMKDIRYCKQQWDRYCKQARASANMPDIHQFETFKDNIHRALRDVSASLTDYTDISNKQQLNLNGIY